MDKGILLAIAMLVTWGIATFKYEAPGLVHLLLTAGVALLIHRIVDRGAPKPAVPPAGTEDTLSAPRRAGQSPARAAPLRFPSC